MFGVCVEGTEPGVRKLDPTSKVGSLIGSVESVTRQILVVFPFASLVEESGILVPVFSFFVAER